MFVFSALVGILSVPQTSFTLGLRSRQNFLAEGRSICCLLVIRISVIEKPVSGKRGGAISLREKFDVWLYGHTRSAFL